ncbi:MAG: transposase [Rhodospirillaceae bacterium]
MPRRPRFDLADVPQHVIQRGNNREAMFYERADYVAYLTWLRDAATKYDCSIYAYVLMTNHMHLLASTARPHGLSSMMQYVGRYFVRYINKKYARSGTLWEGRFRSSLIDTETYFLRCCRYIECNPVRAGMVLHPGDYQWSSFRHHAYGDPDSLLAPHEQYQRLGMTVIQRQRAYRALFQAVIDESEQDEMREAANRGWPLGDNGFKEGIERMLQRPARPPKRGRPCGKLSAPSSVKEGRTDYRVEKLH